jgi:anti-sigma-K factor RskA
MSHPRDDEAAEYAIGTLGPAERQAFEAAMVRDPALAVAVRAWEDRLAPLAEATPSVTPSDAVWSRISAQLASGPSDTVIPFRSDAASLQRLRRSRALWRGLAAGAASLAAALALFIAVERAGPESTLLAVVNRSGDLPALVVRVDPRAGLVQVRALAVETPAGRDLELWSIAGTDAPRSLGVLRGGATRIALQQGAASLHGGETLAVTVEAVGGSPTGAPTTQPVYSGRLIAEMP